MALGLKSLETPDLTLWGRNYYENGRENSVDLFFPEGTFDLNKSFKKIKGYNANYEKKLQIIFWNPGDGTILCRYNGTKLGKKNVSRKIGKID